MPRTLLLEIGCEELPTSFVRNALEQLDRLLPEELDRAGIAHGSAHAMGTARRLSVVARDVVEEIPERREELLGPAESAAVAKDGSWTKAAEGFARKNQVDLASLSIAETPKGRYLRATKLHPGAKSVDRLVDVLSAVIARISFTKSMRWADVDRAFGRPVQWLVALFGEDVVPLAFVGHTAGRSTRGHRFLAPAPFDLVRADDYVDALRKAHVLVDVDERRRVQERVLDEAARSQGGVLVRNAFLEGEVLGLVEEPFAIVGRFDPEYLSLPDELIETVMSHHQRYFAARDPNGRLLPIFISTVNTALRPDLIRKGNERAMRPRLADARFFVEHDRAAKLEASVAKLDGVVYHQKLGTYGDKVLRLEALSRWIAAHVGADEAHVARAARLAKADLVSLTVGEFPELQGVMGRDHARHDGEPAEVANAIAEHYMPKGAEDAVAASKVGATVAIADRIDTLVGFFAIGQKPSGGGDPFGLRRAALGLIRTLMQHRVRMSLAVAFGRAHALYTRDLPRTADETGKELGDFVRERLEGLLVQKFPLDIVRACLAAGHDDPSDVLDRVEALAWFRGQSEFPKVVKAFERVFNISRQAPSGDPDVSKLAGPAEKALLAAHRDVAPRLNERIDQRDFRGALQLVASTLPIPVDRFFEEVFVMDDAHPELRDARLRLLGRIAEEVGTIARFDTLAASARESVGPGPAAT